jgi:hypothetical protein
LQKLAAGVLMRRLSVEQYIKIVAERGGFYGITGSSAAAPSRMVKLFRTGSAFFNEMMT